MARRSLAPCTTHGCPELTRNSSGKCDACQAEAQRASDARRPSSSERGYDTRWRDEAKRYLAAMGRPPCAEPLCTRRATDVDHIDGQGPLGPRGYDWSNFRPYCHPHHSQRTARDQPGGWNRRVGGGP